MIHIVFNASEVDLMKEVIRLDETLAGEVFLVRDDFAVGPIRGLETEEGWRERREWWLGMLPGSPHADLGGFDDRETVAQIISMMEKDPGEQTWIWMGQNQHDVMGYYWLMPQLQAYLGRVMVIYLNNLPFINDKGQLFYPSWLHEIQPREFLKAKKLARPITPSEYEIDPDEWKRLAEENAAIRILEGGKKISAKEEEFYDADILRNLAPEWQKATRVLSNTLHRMKIKTGDLFLMWRMKELIRQGRIEVTGEMEKSWKDFDVRLPGSHTAGQETLVEEKQNS